MDIKIESTAPQPRQQLIDYEHLSVEYNKLKAGSALSIKRVSNITDLRTRLRSRFEVDDALMSYSCGDRTFIVKNRDDALMSAKPRGSHGTV